MMISDAQVAETPELSSNVKMMISNVPVVEVAELPPRDSSELSEYELQRQRNVARNEAVLVSLGLAPPAAPVVTKPSTPLRRKVSVPDEPLRKSSRLATIAASTTNNEPVYAEVVTLPVDHVADDNVLQCAAVPEVSLDSLPPARSPSSWSSDVSRFARRGGSDPSHDDDIPPYIYPYPSWHHQV